MVNSGQLKHLYELLDKAERMAAEYSGGYSNRFCSAEEFHEALADSITKLKAGDQQQLDNLWIWFAPTCTWDDFIGKDGMELANEIFEIIDKHRDEMKL